MTDQPLTPARRAEIEKLPTQLEKRSVAVYLAAEEGPADDLSKSLREAATAIRELLAAVQGEGWQPIETAPERKKVLVSWVNELGKRRTALAVFYPVGTIELDESPEDWVDEDGKNTVAGGWESREAGGDDWYLDEQPTHWMPLPAPPQPDAPSADGRET
jgi:hypothetical protein